MKNGDLNFQHYTNDTKKYLSPKVGIVLTVLIMLQFYLSVYVFSAMGVSFINILYLDTISSYTMVVLSLIFFIPNALGVFRDHFTLWTIAVSCFLPIVFGGERMIFKGILIILGVFFAAYSIVNRKSLKFPGLKSVFIGLGWSVCAVLIIALTYALFDQTLIKPFPSNLSTIVNNEFLNQLSFTSVPEEVCFRGLIFSFMVMNGYKEDKAFVVQAILFWSIHFETIITNPISFFILIPLSTLFLTLIIKKYKMLYLSIMMHTFINVFTTVLVNVINRYLF